MVKNVAELKQTEKKELFYKLVTPRPIAWIVTESKSGVVNVAPFSFYNLVSTNPVTIFVAIGVKADGTPKDTLRNIRETGKATICNVIPEDIEEMKLSGESLPFDESETEKFEIETKKMLADFPPRIANSTSAIFTKFAGEMKGLESKTIPLFLTGEYMYLAEKLWDGEKISQLATTTEGFEEC
jgi:flavin reductase (DIM6/NTAB) family NADH-FMN oxidoreductase RutF